MVKTTASEAMYNDVRKAEKATGLKIEEIGSVVASCVNGQWGVWKIMRCYRSGEKYIVDLRIIQECESEQETDAMVEAMRVKVEGDSGYKTMSLGKNKEEYVEHSLIIKKQVKVDKDYYEYWEKLRMVFGLIGGESEYPIPVRLNIDGQYGVWKILNIYLKDEEYIAEYGLIYKAQDKDDADETWRKILSEMIQSTKNTTLN